MICDSGFHRWSAAQRLMHANKVVVGEMQSARGFQIVQLLAESIRESREAANRHAHREVLPLHMRCADVRRVGSPVTDSGYDLHDWSWGVPPGGVMLAIIAVQLDKLRKVGLSGKHIFNAALVKMETISCQLEALF